MYEEREMHLDDCNVDTLEQQKQKRVNNLASARVVSHFSAVPGFSDRISSTGALLSPRKHGMMGPGMQVPRSLHRSPSVNPNPSSHAVLSRAASGTK